MKKTLVIGGGATGLVAGYLLSRAGKSVEIWEASMRAGGLMNTFDVGSSVPLEHFYHHFFTHDAELHWLLNQLGLSEQIRYRKGTMGFYRNGRHWPFNSAGDLLRCGAISLSGRIRFGLSSTVLAYRNRYLRSEKCAALEWFRRHAGAEATAAIWEPMMRVKFGAAAERIPLSWIACRLRQRVRSRQKGTEKLGYLAGSLQQLTDALLNRLRQSGTTVQTGTAVASLRRQADQWAITAANGRKTTADRIVLTVPTPVAAKLLSSVHPEYARQLNSIEYLGAICTVLSLKRSLTNFYWTNIADEPALDESGRIDANGPDVSARSRYDARFGGVIEHTRLVDPGIYGGQHLVYLSRYAAEDEPIWNMNDKELLQAQLSGLSRIFQCDAENDLVRSWVFRTRFAAPLTDLGFAAKVQPFATPLPGIFQASMCHLYPEERSVNNSIRVAAELLSAMGEHKAADPVPRGISIAGQVGHRAQADRRAA